MAAVKRASERFRKMVDRVLGHEGGYSNNSKDPGGETQWGISKRSYPHLNIKELTRDDAIQIYYEDFWLLVRGDDIHPLKAWQMFDAAVNSGIGNSLRFAQRAMGLMDDGFWGPVTREAIQTFEVNDFAFLFMAERFEFWAKARNADEFWRGWVRRGAGNLRYAASDNDFIKEL